MKRILLLFVILNLLLGIPTYAQQGQDCEPNNILSEATELSADIPTNCFIGTPGDVDFFSYTNSEPGIIIVSITSVPAELEIEGQLLAPNGESVIDTDTGGSSENVFLFGSTCSVGTHYIRLEDVDFFNDSDDSDSYTIEVNFIPFQDIDPTECQNNALDEAAPIEFGTSITAAIVPNVYDFGSVNSNEDDYYLLNVTEPGVIEILVADMSNDFNIGGELYAPPNYTNIIAQNPSPGDGNPSTYRVSVCTPGEYILKLSDEGFFNNSTVSPNEAFTITANFFPFSEIDPLECNNSPANAAELVFCNYEAIIAPRFDVNSTSRDVDYYKKTLTQGENLSVTINNFPASFQLDITLLNSLGEQIEFYNNVISQVIDYDAETSGDYFILVEAANAGTFDMGISYIITQPPGTCDDQATCPDFTSNAQTQNVTANSAQLSTTTSITPVSREFRYGLLGNPNWINTITTPGTETSVVLTDLMSCTEYQWQFRIECEAGVFSDWEELSTFETEGDCEDDPPSGGELTFVFNDVIGTSGSTVTVPVTILNFNAVSSFQFSLALSDPTVGTITGLGATPFAPSGTFFSNGIVTALSDGGAYQTLEDGNLVLELEVELTGAPSDCTVIDVTNAVAFTASVENPGSPFPNSVLPLSIAGEVCVSQIVEFSGQVYREDFDPVNLTDIDCSNGDTDQTGTNGLYNLPNILQGGDYVITASKNTDPDNGVNVTDLVVINNHILGIELLDSPYKLIAANAQEDDFNTVTVVDIQVIQAIILSAGTLDFPFHDSWRFVPEAYTFQDPGNPFNENFPTALTLNNISGNVTNANFIGIKMGDVDLTNNPANLLASEDLQLRAASRDFLPGEVVELQVSAENFNNIAGFQADLLFDAGKLQFTEVVGDNLAGFSSANIGTTQVAEGRLPLLWYALQGGGQSYAAEEQLFIVRFTALEAGTTKNVFKLSEERQVTVQPGAAPGGVDLTFFDTNTTAIELTETLRVGQVRPNPFAERSTLPLFSDVACEAVFSIQNVEGKIISERVVRLPAGSAEIEISAGELPNKGLYFYRLTLDGKSYTGRFVSL